MNPLKKFFRNLFPRKTAIDFPTSYIQHRFFLDHITAGPILVIGDFTGRDYTTLKEKFGDVYLLDLVDNRIAEKEFFVQQSVTEPIKLPPDHFRYALMGEVIEHVWEDKRTLEGVRKVLRDDGQLLITVPFGDEPNFPEFHYHIYGRTSMKRLLEHSGFEVVEMQYRGFINAIAQHNEIAALLAILLYPFFGAESLEKVNSFFYFLHKIFAPFEWLNKPFQGFGGFVVARKSSLQIDPLEVQRKSFTL